MSKTETKEQKQAARQARQLEKQSAKEAKRTAAARIHRDPYMLCSRTDKEGVVGLSVGLRDWMVQQGIYKYSAFPWYLIVFVLGMALFLYLAFGLSYTTPI